MNSYSKKFDLNKETELKEKLQKNNFSFKPFAHALWRAEASGVNATLYNSGKLLIQGKGTSEFVQKYLNETICEQAKLNIEIASNSKHSCWIGTDESGKGDYFGPLVVAGVMATAENIKIFEDLGVQDSKKIKDSTIEKIAWQIKNNCTFSIVTITPTKYNELYPKFNNNLNNLLAWGHARAIENILEKKECEYALSDKFGNESLILNALMKKGKNIKLEQRTKAEDDIAVAAASILARHEFVQRIKKLSEEYGLELPKGASGKVKEQASMFIRKYGKENLKNIAKLHFKTTSELV